MEERTSLERVVELAGPVRREDHGGPPPRGDRAELGDRDLEVREHLEQEGLELLVGAVDLVDQEHDRLVPVDRLEERPADEVLGPEELLLADRPLLRGADVQQLARVVPLVDRVRDVEPLVALQPDQPRAEDGGERLRGLRLPDPRLALEQHGLRERERQEERGREPAVRQVVGPAKRLLELVDRAELQATERSPRTAGQAASRSSRAVASSTDRSSEPISTSSPSASDGSSARPRSPPGCGARRT